MDNIFLLFLASSIKVAKDTKFMSFSYRLSLTAVSQKYGKELGGMMVNFLSLSTRISPRNRAI